MMDKPTNGYYATIHKWSSGELVKILGPYSSIRQAEKAERGFNINIHEDYYTDSAWFGPDIEPTEGGF